MIILKNVTLRRGAKVLLDKTSVTINPGEKVGLVGRNGTGKSTLFALLNGSLHEDGGDCNVPPQWRMAQVAQDITDTVRAAVGPCLITRYAVDPRPGEPQDAEVVATSPVCRNPWPYLVPETIDWYREWLASHS